MQIAKNFSLLGENQGFDGKKHPAVLHGRIDAWSEKRTHPFEVRMEHEALFWAGVMEDQAVLLSLQNTQHAT